jgi:hypothetical protein
MSMNLEYEGKPGKTRLVSIQQFLRNQEAAVFNDWSPNLNPRWDDSKNEHCCEHIILYLFI